jgi:hypothetical protein
MISQTNRKAEVKNSNNRWSKAQVWSIVVVMGVILGIIGSCITIYEFPSFFRDGQSLGTTSSSTAPSSTSSGPSQASKSPTGSGNTPTQTQQTSPSTPTLNPCSSKSDAGTVLYKADWSKDANGWVGAGDWTTVNGALVTAGNGTPPIFAPYHPGDNCIADYAIEVKITVIKYNDQQEDGFGLVIRATSEGGGYSFSICAKQKYAFGSIVASCADDSGAAQNIYRALLLVGQNFPDGGTVLGGQAFRPHVVQHVYRLEAKANTITAFIDGNRIIGPVTENTYLSGGQVSIYSENTQLSIDTFKVIAL